MTYGTILLICGIALIGAGLLTIIIGAMVMRSKKRQIKEQLYDKYGL